MSTPYSGGTDPRENHPENFGEGTYGTPDNNSTDYYGYNAYGSSTGYNPYDVNAGIAGEDATRFHGTTLVDGTYGDGTQPHPVNDPAANGFTHLKGTGKMNAIEAWGFGFKQTFANWRFWIVIGLCFSFLPLLLNLADVFLDNGLLSTVNFLVSIALILLYPFLYSFVLLQTLSRRWKFSGMKAPAYGSTLGMMILIGVIFTVIYVAVAIVVGLIFGSIFASAFEGLNPTMIGEDPVATVTVVKAALGFIAVLVVISFLIMPFSLFPSWYAADSVGFGTAFSEGFKAGARNYGQLLLFFLVWTAVSIPAILTAGLGLLVIAPASYLAMAYAYRQVSGGPVPTDAPAGNTTQL